MKVITESLRYQKIHKKINNQDITIHITLLDQNTNSHLTLLLSKVSEAILPNIQGNHIGEGTYMSEYLKYQKGVRFIINGGFNHYRKNFYNWSHQNYEVGDPVGLVKIREHYFEDYVDLQYYGFLTQENKGDVWTIKKPSEITRQEKYILGCTPLLLYKREKIELPLSLMAPLEPNKINPPSILAHGLQLHPRTAVGIKNKTLYFFVIEAPGCTLLDLQNLGVDLGLDELLNLDGGGSSQFRIIQNDKIIIQNKVDEEDSKRVLGHVLVLFDESLK